MEYLFAFAWFKENVLKVTLLKNKPNDATGYKTIDKSYMQVLFL